jgi:CBS domain-containing protein
MTVKAILAAKGSEVSTIDPTANLATAAKLLVEQRIGALVVIGPDRRVIGIVSERDIVTKLVAHGSAALELPLTEVMTRNFINCSASDTISSIMDQMTQGRSRHLPVIEQGKLIGIVSIGDVVKSRLEAMGREQLALRDYIQTA